jgi:hypothetical protein
VGRQCREPNQEIDGPGDHGSEPSLVLVKLCIGQSRRGSSNYTFLREIFFSGHTDLDPHFFARALDNTRRPKIY